MFPTSEDEIPINVNEIDKGDCLGNLIDDSYICYSVEEVIEDKTNVPSNDNPMKNEGEQSEIKLEVSVPIDIKPNPTISNDTNDVLPSPLSTPIRFKPIVEQPSSTEDYYYELSPENFHAEQV